MWVFCYDELIKIYRTKSTFGLLLLAIIIVEMLLLYYTSAGIRNKYQLAHLYDSSLTFDSFVYAEYSHKINFLKLVNIYSITMFMAENDKKNNFWETLKVLPVNKRKWVVAKAFAVWLCSLGGWLTLLGISWMAISKAVPYQFANMLSFFAVDIVASFVVIILLIGWIFVLKIDFWLYTLVIVVLYAAHLLGNPLAPIYLFVLNDFSSQYLASIGISTGWAIITLLMIK